MCKIPRLRNIATAHEWLKQEDEETVLTESQLRDLVAKGIIPSVRSGKKILINIDILPDAISAWVAQMEVKSLQLQDKPVPATERSEPVGKYGQVRAI